MTLAGGSDGSSAVSGLLWLLLAGPCCCAGAGAEQVSQAPAPAARHTAASAGTRQHLATTSTAAGHQLHCSVNIITGVVVWYLYAADGLKWQLSLRVETKLEELVPGGGWAI